jgi:hypothetical protein
MAAIWRRGIYFPCRQTADRKYRLALRAAATKSASRSWLLADLYLNDLNIKYYSRQSADWVLGVRLRRTQLAALAPS